MDSEGRKPPSQRVLSKHVSDELSRACGLGANQLPAARQLEKLRDTISNKHKAFGILLRQRKAAIGASKCTFTWALVEYALCRGAYTQNERPSIC